MDTSSPSSLQAEAGRSLEQEFKASLGIKGRAPYPMSNQERLRLKVTTWADLLHMHLSLQQRMFVCVFMCMYVSEEVTG